MTRVPVIYLVPFDDYADISAEEFKKIEDIVKEAAAKGVSDDPRVVWLERPDDDA